MGIMESKLEPQKTKQLVTPESSLPSFSLDTAKFSDGSSGFIITTIDLAKNSTTRTISIKFIYSPSENSYIFVGKDETTLSFVRDRISGDVICSVKSVLKENIVRFCVTTYDPIDDSLIDKIGELYSKQSQKPS